MDIRINRFKVSYQGEVYGPGDVIYGVDQKEGTKLVKESNGEIEELPSRVENETNEQGGEGGDPTLSPVDPSKTVK